MEEKITFEDNMKRLGAIVSELEKGDIPLEKAVELYGEGMKLSVQCRKQLEEAQLRITEDGGSISSAEVQ
ncbi:MAG: exodeoxyribonuclease VII small subunit [Ruminococcus sp.]|nr:exodeoxyribonuclease VII small subunit [Ruminococcus sp.]